MKKSSIRCLTCFIVLLIIYQTIFTNTVLAYPATNVGGKPLNNAMSTQVGFGIYGIASNGTGVATGVIPSGMTVAQVLQSGQWRYFGYNYDNNLISNDAFPGDYSGPTGTKIGGKAGTWRNTSATDYSRITKATNADSGDSKSAKDIGIDYCDLIQEASASTSGSFRVWFFVPPTSSYPNGRTMYMTYIIPKDDTVNRYSFIYYRIDGTSTSLLSGGTQYEKNTYPFKITQSQSVSFTGKSFPGYEFTRSITSTSTSGGFANEIQGDSGKTRTGTLSYASTNEFDVVFYYKPIVVVTPPVDPPPIIPGDPTKPVAIINAPSSVLEGSSADIVGSGTDSGGLPIIDYEWTSTGSPLTGTGGSMIINGYVSLSLRVENSLGVWSDIVYHTISTEAVPDPPPPPEPPTAHIFGMSSVVIGEDCSLYGYGSDPDNDIVSTSMSISPTYNGSNSGGTALVWFSTVGFYTATLTVVDSTGLSDTASMLVQALPAYPTAYIEKFGVEKENRKVTLDCFNFSNSGSKRFAIDWSKTQWELTPISTGLTQNEIKTSESYTGSKTINLLFKKPGQYKAKVTLYNTAGYSNSNEIILNIIKDELPIVNFNLNSNNLKRDPNDLSPSGLAQATIKITDNSMTNDGDTIAKRGYVICFDTNNDGKFDNEQCYIYDLDYVGNTLPFTDSLNAHLKPICLYKDIKSIDINPINTGNKTSFELKTTNVGKFVFEEIAIEEFGQPTIDAFVNQYDRKVGNSFNN